MSFVPELKPFRLVSVDNPGCGDSSYDEKHPLNLDAVVELVGNFVEQLGLTRFLLVGGSMVSSLQAFMRLERPRLGAVKSD